MGIVSTALNQYAATQNRAWASDRSQTVGASDVGQCARKTFWSKNEGDPVHGAPRDPDYVDSWGARVRGTIMENEFWAPAMLAQYGDRMLFAGKEQQTFTLGFLSATPDGLITGCAPNEIAPGSGSEVTAECKSADPRTNLSEAKAENVFQTHVQMGLIRELTPYKPTHSVLSYMDASFWSEVREFVIPFDPKIFAAAQARATTIMTATDASELKAEGHIAGGNECNYCPFTRACGVERRRVPEGTDIVDPQFVAEATDLAREIKRLKAGIDDDDERVRSLQEDLKARLRAKGVRKIPGVLSWSAVKGRPSYNNTGIREAAVQAGVDISRFETVGEPTDRLAIQLPAEAGADQQAA